MKKKGGKQKATANGASVNYKSPAKRKRKASTDGQDELAKRLRAAKTPGKRAAIAETDAVVLAGADLPEMQDKPKRKPVRASQRRGPSMMMGPSAFSLPGLPSGLPMPSKEGSGTQTAAETDQGEEVSVEDATRNMMMRLDGRPACSLEDCRVIMESMYQLPMLKGSCLELGSFYDRNFYFRAQERGFAWGYQYVVKLHNAYDSEKCLGLIEALSDVLVHLRGKGIQCHNVWADSTGKRLPTVLLPLNPVPGETRKAHVLCLKDFVPGKIMGDKPRDAALYRKLGLYFGQLTEAMMDFKHPACDRPNHSWDLQRFPGVRNFLPSLNDDSWVELVTEVLDEFDAVVEPRRESIRMGTAHNDGHGWNTVLTEDESEVRCVIDFDVCYSFAVSDISIAIGYAIITAENKMEIVENMLRGFSAAFPVQEEEAQVIPVLIKAIIAGSTTLSLHAHLAEPTSEYLACDVDNPRACLTELRKLPLRETVLRALGYAP